MTELPPEVRVNDHDEGASLGVWDGSKFQYVEHTLTEEEAEAVARWLLDSAEEEL